MYVVGQFGIYNGISPTGRGSDSFAIGELDNFIVNFNSVILLKPSARIYFY